jgi:hypothetical protein
MPGIAHEGPVELLRHNPALAADLLGFSGVPVPADATAAMAAGELTSPLPAEFRADAVVTLTGPKAKLAVVIEVQTSPNPDKHRVWPAYLALARAHHDCPTFLLVICPSRATGRWARQPIATGHPGFTLIPLVIDATSTPPPGAAGSPGSGPELAVLGALTGAIDLNQDSGRRQVLGIVAAADLDEDRLETYTHLVRAAAPVAARAHLEALMAIAFKDDFIERYKAEGHAEGVAQGKASMVLRILAARGFDVPGQLSDAVMACTDPGQLDRWGEAAATAVSLDDVFNGHH